MGVYNSDSEVDGIVKELIADFAGGRQIDEVQIRTMPDKAEAHELVRNLFRIIYPGYFRDRSFKIYNPRHSFAVSIEDIFYHLHKQITQALSFGSPGDADRLSAGETAAEARRLCLAFFRSLPKVREYVQTDLEASYSGDPAAGSVQEVIMTYPGLMALTVYRLAHELYLLKVPVLPRLMTEYAHTETGIDIHPGASIGKYCFIDHGTGTVIGETAVIGENVRIYQGVTIGALSVRSGQKTAGLRRHPTIGDNVTIYAGASILGGDTVIGANSVIGGNTFITCSVEPGTRVSIKNPEKEYRTADNRTVREDLRQGDAWYYII